VPLPHRTEPVELRRALDTVSLALFAYLTVVVTAVVVVGGQPWSPSPWMLGAATSLAVWFGSRAFPRWAARIARRFTETGERAELGSLAPDRPVPAAMRARRR
jgi:hypothetical protein